MNADFYYWYKRVILYHNTYESEIGDYNQSSLADFFRSHLMSEKEAKSYTGEKVHYSYIQRVASLYIAAFLIMYSLFLIHKSIPVIQSPKITF
jgi:hypothetical protein